jgi:hypothetical protein
MSEIRIIFSPHTAEPQFLREVTVAMVSAQIVVAQAMWMAQLHVLRTMMTAQFTVLDTVYRASTRRG